MIATIANHMEQQKIIADFEARATALGMSIGAICEEAGIHRTSFSRWKLSDKNPKPIGLTLHSLNKMNAAFERLERSGIAA